MTSLLFQAVKAGEYNKALHAIEEGADVNALDNEKWTPLHYAIESGYEDIISMLVDRGADINQPNSAGFVAYQIMMICEQYSPATAYKLIQAGAEVGSDLHKSILLRDTDMSGNLIAQGYLVNVKDSLGNTPLHIAVAVNDIETAVLLLDNGALIEAQDCYLTTPLQEASAMGLEDIVAMLIKRQADLESIDYNNRTALIFAAGNAHYEVTKMLLLAGADPNSDDVFGNTSLHYAYENEEFEIIDLLLEYGADQDMINEDGLTPIQLLPGYTE